MKDVFFNSPSLIGVPGVSDRLLDSLFKMAAEFYRHSPWRSLSTDLPIEIWYPPCAQSRIAVVMGSAGQAFGLSIYDNQEDIRHVFSASTPLDGFDQISWLALSYDPMHYLAAEDAAYIKENGLLVVNEAAYPVITRVGAPGPDLHPPTLADIEWLECTLSGFNQMLGEADLSGHVQRYFGYQATLEVHTHCGLRDIQIKVATEDATLKPGAMHDRG
jgi:hypothetical protein